MYEELAWKNFCKTGDLESFLEYKKINEINVKNSNSISNEGINLDGLDKSKGNNN